VLRRIELEVLSTVDRGDTISELAMKLDHSESYLSRAVADLVDKGLVYTERDGRRKQVVPSDARAVELYQDLVRQHSHIEFPELLTGKALEVLYYLDQPRTVAEIADQTTTTAIRSTVSSSGFATAASSGWTTVTMTSTPTSTASTRLPGNSHTISIDNASKPSPRRAYDSLGGLRRIPRQAETEIDAEGFHETGLARFAAFDLQFLLTDHRYYRYSETLDEVSPAELCCHTLLIDNGSHHRSYCLLLLSHVDVDEADLRVQAVKYGLEDEIDALLQYLETHGKIQDGRLSEWSEFQELAADYEVDLPNETNLWTRVHRGRVPANRGWALTPYGLPTLDRVRRDGDTVRPVGVVRSRLRGGKAAVWSGNAASFDLVVDATKMLAATLR